MTSTSTKPSHKVRNTIVSIVTALTGLVAGSLIGMWFQNRPASPLEYHPAASTEVVSAPITITYSTTGGAFRVPSQVAPGLYTITSQTTEFVCSWKRVKDWQNRPTSILGKVVEVERGKNVDVRVYPTDIGVIMGGDCMWRRK